MLRAEPVPFEFRKLFNAINVSVTTDAEMKYCFKNSDIYAGVFSCFQKDTCLSKS